MSASVNCPEDKIIILKTGSSGVFHMTYTDDSEPPVPIDLTDYEIYMDFKHPRTGVVIFAASLEDGIIILDAAEGTYAVNAEDTSAWPLGLMPIDIKYENKGVSQHTETFQLNIQKGITQGVSK